MILTRTETTAERLVRAHRTIRSMAWMLILAFVMIGCATYGNVARERIIQAQDAQITACKARINDLTAQVAQQPTGEITTQEAVSRGAMSRRITVDEMRELAGTVHMEAQGEPYFGKVLVARVALNRWHWNPDKSLHEILTNPNAFATGAEYDSQDMEAVQEAMADTEYLHLAGFHNPKTATNPEAKEHEILLTVGNHDFW